MTTKMPNPTKTGPQLSGPLPPRKPRPLPPLLAVLPLAKYRNMVEKQRLHYCTIPYHLCPSETEDTYPCMSSPMSADKHECQQRFVCDDVY